MRCIFCKSDSSSSVPVEHIVPESLGNVAHVLPIGAVCDGCNQYFARKVEKPLLDSPMFRQLRARMGIPNKRGRIPKWQVQEGSALPNYRQMGRFLAKVGLEVLAFKASMAPGWSAELVQHEGFDELRGFARYNKGVDWPFTVRTLHPVNAQFSDGGETFELLHEFDILVTATSEMYVVLSLLGVEFVLNLGGRVNDGFRQWLEQHDWHSPLHVEQVKFTT